VISPTHATFWTVWVPPFNGLQSRYVVGYPVAISQTTRAERLAGVPQAAVTLETWNHTSGKKRTTTVNPYGGITSEGATEPGWSPATSLGYIMTACPNSVTSNDCDSIGAATANRIEECWQATTNDYQLNIDNHSIYGTCPGQDHYPDPGTWLHVRTA